ncbi:MAG TPA: acetoacetate--CoA ligase [Solirubrobacterales bacterium]|nr:acetoacetate--CoA ligase [Solirubrobacterales bacterium]
MTPADGTPPILWQPSAQLKSDARITTYMAWLRRERGVRVETYDELWRWSVDAIDEFWASIWDYFEVRSTAPYESVLGDRRMPGAEWFPGARLSFAEHIFADRDDAAVAILHASEIRELTEVTWGELRSLTASIAAGLRGLGVGPGDRVCAYLPNIAEAMAAFFACASIGAIWSSCSPDFGLGSAVDRFAQIEPKVLIAVDGYRYNGRDFDRMETVRSLEREIDSIEHTVLLAYLDAAADPATLASGMTFGDLLAAGGEAELEFEQLPFDHPLWILYSSGTTGRPKAIVHSQGGILLEHLKKLNLHLDAHAGDRVFWFSTTGWMMWNFLAGVLLTPASIVLYDGSPGHPDMNVLWDLAERAKVTCFGTSAAFIGGCMKAGIEPGKGRDLSALRSIGSTGSPLSPDGFRWVYDQLGSEVWLFSTSGGTDLCTAFVGGCPLLPVHEGELQARSLGADLHAFDEDGVALVGEIGELVLTQPMPSMPVQIWNDPDGSRLRGAYFEFYPGIWRHGDWIEITDRGTAVIYGRSDSTINRGGIRMGTSEIYRAVLGVDEIVDALVVDVPADRSAAARKAGVAEDESWMPLFVVLREDVDLDPELIKTIARRIREQCSPRHVPDDVFAVAEVPRTLSGKVLEVPIKRILMGTEAEQAASRDSLQNPAALDWFVALAAADPA